MISAASRARYAGSRCWASAASTEATLVATDALRSRPSRCARTGPLAYSASSSAVSITCESASWTTRPSMYGMRAGARGLLVEEPLARVGQPVEQRRRRPERVTRLLAELAHAVPDRARADAVRP